MQFYLEYLSGQGYDVKYIDSQHPWNDCRKLIAGIKKQGVTTIHYAEPEDYLLEKRIDRSAEQAGILTLCDATPYFLNSRQEVVDYFKNKKHYFQTDFYIHQRKKRKLLLTAEGKPEGSQWSYDADNRQRFPKSGSIPHYPFPESNKYVKEAVSYVQQWFPDNYGKAGAPFTAYESAFYPVTFAESDEWLEAFLNQRLRDFGPYEDAMVGTQSILYHSVLTPMLNIGLLEPQHILDTTLSRIQKLDIPLNSLEGFIRQIIGWREFIRGVYQTAGSRQRTKHYWGFTRKIPAAFWLGETGIQPIDQVIKRVLESGYTHHIERLMVLGNFMLLCEFDPDEVYRWFMELFVDAYDWVMVPNVYGMTQFADGGLMTTKPYISGSNYLMKMGDFAKGPWQEIWDGLFWRFMHQHRHFFTSNPRLGMLVGTFDKMPHEKKQKHLTIATKYLDGLDKQND